MKTRKISLLISAIITFLATVIITSFCVSDWSGVTPWAFSMILFSEIVFFGGLILLERASEGTAQVITRSIISTLLFSYLIVNVIFSTICIVFFKESNKTFVVLEVIFVAILAIGVVVSLVASKSIYKSNEKTMRAVTNIDGLIIRLNKLAESPVCEAYAVALKKISDGLRFTDISVNVSEDREIEDLISSIEIEVADNEELDSKKFNSNMIHLNSLIAKRKIATVECKKGMI